MTPPPPELETAGIERLREYELEEARNLQRAMVPTEPLARGAIEVLHQFQPAAGVGGDFLDYFLLSDNTVGLYLGDVVGKGLPAALYAALVVGTLRGINKTGEAPSHVLGQLNRRLRTRAMPGRFCAVQYAVFDPVTCVLEFASAGMAGPLQLTAQGCREFRAEGLPSGLFDAAAYEAMSLQLEPGESVLFLTDGLCDALNAVGDEFSMDRLMEVCAGLRHAPPHELLQRIFAEVGRFAGSAGQYDDMTAALLRIAP